MKAGTTDNEYVNMIIEEEVSSKSPVILEGFPGIGLVGNIVATQIASELKMTQIGTIESRLFPPITVLFDGLTHAPVRIYEDPQNNFIVVLSDILIHPMIAYDIGKSSYWLGAESERETQHTDRRYRHDARRTHRLCGRNWRRTTQSREGQNRDLGDRKHLGYRRKHNE